MAPPRVLMLREWTNGSPISEKTDDAVDTQNGPPAGETTDDVIDTPVIATLVSNGLPRIYRKGNVLIQHAYGQIGQHFNQLNQLNPFPPAPLQAIPSMDHSFDLEIQPSYSSCLYDDGLDEGAVQIVNGEWLVTPVDQDVDEDDLYDQAVQNRRRSKWKTRNKEQGTGGKLRKIFSRGRGKTCDKGKKQKDTNITDKFPLPAPGGDTRKGKRIIIRKHKKQNNASSEQSVLFATPCMDPRKLYHKQETIDKNNVSAPSKQHMSRAALDFMEEPLIVQQDYVSELDTDIDEDPTRISHAHTDTDIDIDAAFKSPYTLQSPSSIEESDSNVEDELFCNFIEENKKILDSRNGERSRLETNQIDSIGDRRNHVRTKSLPNLSKGPSSSIHENRLKQYRSHLDNVSRLSTQLQCPATPRKQRSRGSDSPREVAGVNSPPQQSFDRLSKTTPPLPTRKRPSSASPRHQSTFPPQERFNDSLKVVFVGSPSSADSSLVNDLTNCSKRNGSGRIVDINVQSWIPEPMHGEKNIKFNLWDLQGANLETGAHHATKTLFFSSKSLYVIVWDLPVNNRQRLSTLGSEGSDCDSDYEEALRNEQMQEQIESEIDDHVMYWINLLSESSLAGCAIMPVVTCMESVDEVDLRCNLLKRRLEKYERNRKKGSDTPQLVFNSQGNITRVPSKKEGGMAELKESLLGVTNGRDGTPTVFHSHLQSKLGAVLSSVQQSVSKFKEKGCKVVRLEHILVKVMETAPHVENFSQSLVVDALIFLSSIGEVTYFGATNTNCTRPHILEEFIVLNPKWLSNALSLAFRTFQKDSNNDHLSDVGELYQSLPVLTHDKTVQLWKDTDFVRKVSEKICQGNSNDLYSFLQQICEHCGLFVPFSMTTRKRGSKHICYLLPMFATPVPEKFWSYKVKDNHKTPLCNIFTFFDTIPCGFMDKVAASVLKDLSEVTASSTKIKIQHVFHWKTAIYANVTEEVDKKQYIFEVFVQLTNHDSSRKGNSAGAVPERRKLIVSAKGYEGGWGEKIWTLGYRAILDSIEHLASIHLPGSVKRGVVCPGCCLLETQLSKATVWDYENLNYGDEPIRCSKGHSAYPQLLLGPDDVDDCASVATGVTSVYSTYSAMSAYTHSSSCIQRKADVMLPAVVIVGLWDTVEKKVISVGSGFIVSKRKGFIITASHVLFNFKGDKEYGRIDQEFFGIPGATAIIGMNRDGHNSAVFTYSADIVASDVLKVDGCVLKIKKKFERPIELDCIQLAKRAEFPLSSVRQERLQRLIMTTEYEREQEVRILGFRQTGEGILAEGARINRVACVNKGFVCKPLDTNSYYSDDEFCPRSEIVVNCPTGVGNSGGPFVNAKGEVIGILSRVDPVEKERCYLTASKELKILLSEAREKSDSENNPYLSSFNQEHF